MWTGASSSAARHERASSWRDRMSFHVLLVLGREAIVRRQTVDPAVTQEDLHVFRLAESGRRVDQSVEHSLDVERRAADDF